MKNSEKDLKIWSLEIQTALRESDLKKSNVSLQKSLQKFKNLNWKSERFIKNIFLIKKRQGRWDKFPNMSLKNTILLWSFREIDWSADRTRNKTMISPWIFAKEGQWTRTGMLQTSSLTFSKPVSLFYLPSSARCRLAVLFISPFFAKHIFSCFVDRNRFIEKRQWRWCMYHALRSPGCALSCCFIESFAQLSQSDRSRSSDFVKRYPF